MENRENGQILRKVQLSMSKSGRNRNYEKRITNNQIKTVTKKNLPKTKVQGQMASNVNSFKHLEKS